MDAKVWQRYVAVTCSQAWALDMHDTEDVLACIETLAAAVPPDGSAMIRVLLHTGIGEIAVDRGQRVRIGFRV